MATLLESYKNRLAVSEAMFGKSHEGAKMDSHRKVAVAKCLQNIDKFLSEAFDSTNGTQRADLGSWKKFCLNLTTVGLPNLIAHDLVMVNPMSSITGFVTYVEYTTSTTKGADAAGRFLNNPFELGGPKDLGFSSYTADRVVETAATPAADLVVSWTPTVKGVFKTYTDPVSGQTVELNSEIEWNKAGKPTTTAYDVKVTATNGTVTYKNFQSDGKTVLSTDLSDGARVAYVYDNIVIPQEKLPTIKAEIKNITLEAKARRIAVYYSQIAAFQAKTDYGFDLGDQLAEKAVGQLNYEIDTEIVEFLNTLAGGVKDELTWSKTLPVGVNKADHYQGFSEILEIAKQLVYDATQRFVPNYMVCASNLIPVLSFIKEWKPASVSNINGPYFAGTFGTLKVFVSPAMTAGEYIIGVNGDDYMSSAAVYAPYMAIVPTQLLQFADGGTTQGWSTMYDLKALNPNLVIKGKIVA